eukprot:jgi/Bigna1/147074/aug1.128_g21782
MPVVHARFPAGVKLVAVIASRMIECRIGIQLYEQQLERMYTFKLLLLGAGESGKSTILKQIKLINRWTPSEEELSRARIGLKTNILECMQNIVDKAEEFENIIDSKHKDTVEMLKKKKEDISDEDEIDEFFTPNIAKHLQQLLECKAIQETLKRRSEFWLLESFDFLMKNMERIAAPDYQPTEEDVVTARVRTTGIVKTTFEQKVLGDPDTVNYQVVDVGGQRSERKKWLNLFSDVSAVLFVSNLAGYNKRLFEDQNANRMTESLGLFEQICKEKAFEGIPIYLILNKKDLFEKEIARKDLQDYFQDYKGNNSSMIEAKLDVKGLFEQIKRQTYSETKQEILRKDAAEIKSSLRRLRTHIEHKSKKTKGDEVKLQNHAKEIM